MSRRFIRAFEKTKSPYVRGLLRGSGPVVPLLKPVSERGEGSGKSEVFHDFIPDVSGGFLPPEAEFLFDLER